MPPVWVFFKWEFGNYNGSGECCPRQIESAQYRLDSALMERDGKLWIFYAGGYNNEPQQIGVAWSTDGFGWHHLLEQPILPTGAPGNWNNSESGHSEFSPTRKRAHIFVLSKQQRRRQKPVFVQSRDRLARRQAAACAVKIWFRCANSCLGAPKPDFFENGSLSI